MALVHTCKDLFVCYKLTSYQFCHFHNNNNNKTDIIYLHLLKMEIFGDDECIK